MKSPNSLKTASLLACLVTAPHIHAQSSVTLYGIMDAGVRTASGLDPSNVRSAGNANMLNSGINTTSRLGFRGT